MRGMYLALLVGAAVVSAAGRAEDVVPADVCKAPQDVTLTGTIRGLRSWREEPQAEPETVFDLVLGEALCGAAAVRASTIGLTVCRDADTVTMSGRFYPPDELFPAMMIHGEIVSCRPSQP